jgi:DNA-binding response OmpR family regulator
MNKIEKILIAEDELLFVKVMRLEFEKKGFQIESVVDAQNAFAKAVEYQPDLILLDVRLKNNTSGIEAARKIRAFGIQTPIIFTTGNSFESTRSQIEDISNAKILIKPIDFRQLFELILNLELNF